MYSISTTYMTCIMYVCVYIYNSEGDEVGILISQLYCWLGALKKVLPWKCLKSRLNDIIIA